QQAFSGEFEAARKDLQKQEMELSKQKAVLGQQAFEERVRGFNEEVAAFQRRYQTALRALEKSTAAAHNQLQKATIEATSEVASEMGAGLVLHKQNVFLHDERMDVTDAVIERVNKRLPSVAFPPPEVEGLGKPSPSKPSKK
ncbi:MAG: OmpH family outer membrane protein, partial [Pseudomonadota bacterium]